MEFNKINSEYLKINDSFPLPIGMPFPLFSNLAGIVLPSTAKFIELTKDLTGVGLFNEGKLSTQTLVSVSGNVRRYTAVISMVSSPLNGQVIPLINSTEVSNTAGVWTNVPAVLGAMGDLANQFFQNQGQGHRHAYQLTSGATGFWLEGGGNLATGGGGVGNPSGNMTIMNPNTDGSNGAVRTGTQTRQDTYAVKYYLRIK